MCQIEHALSIVAGQLYVTRGALSRSQERVALDANIAVQTYRRLESGSGGSSLGSLLRAMLALDLKYLRIVHTERVRIVSGEAEPPPAHCASCGSALGLQRPEGSGGDPDVR